MPRNSALHAITRELSNDLPALKNRLLERLIHFVGRDPISASDRDWFYALAYTVRDGLVEGWMETMRSYYREDAKRVYYLSLEFLIGRSLVNNLINTGLYEPVKEVLAELGTDIDRIGALEYEAALGNGGLGRLAACFLDSMATLGLPAYGYGIRYEYGMFNQQIENGEQVEHPENWLRYGNPWEFARPEMLYTVHFNGRVVEFKDEFGVLHSHWCDTEDVMAMAYDIPVPGFGGKAVNNMRLWSAKATSDFDLSYFNQGNYLNAVRERNETETLSRVLYPDDTTEMGRELRLKQEYFFVSATIQDIIARYIKVHPSIDGLADKVAIQLNDTHPAIAVPELMRILIDQHRLTWEHAWEITTNCFSYTNHTLLPEALETWPAALLEKVLPRHMRIIFEINQRFLSEIIHRNPGNVELMRRMSLISEDGGEKRVRMGYLAFVGSHKVNGVARIHTELMKSTTFADFHKVFPDRIINMTNGITPRRWLRKANPGLADLITSQIGDGWVADLDKLRDLVPLAEDKAFRKKFQAVKFANKQRMAALAKSQYGRELDPNTFFDVQVKRIHEYKRQLLNVLYTITRYNRIRNNPDIDIVPRTVIFAGKAAPGYAQAKRIIRLINDVGDIINNDPIVRGRLKVLFVPNYDVSLAEQLIPSADLSEQISTAGTEASGTGNMKLSLNGALTIGTRDGANIEIGEAVGEENIFFFGKTTDEIAELYQPGRYNPWDHYNNNPELRAALDMIGSSFFSPNQADRYRAIFDTLLTHGDHYRLLADFEDYSAKQDAVDALYRNPDEWTRRCILNVANVGRFSSDRTINEYAKDIWNVKPVFRRG